MPAKTKKKTLEKNEEREKILEEVELALSEASPEEKASEETQEKVQEEVREEVTQEDETPSEPQEPQSIFETPPEGGVTQKKGKKSSVVIIVICLSIISLLAGFVGGYFYGKGGIDLNFAPTPTPTPTPTSTPTPEEIDLSAYTIEVLNGSGVAGVAGDEKEALTEEGFNVENVGNADNQDYSETNISFKSTVSEDFIDKLKESLGKRYTLAENSEELSEDEDYDVIVILGSPEN